MENVTNESLINKLDNIKIGYININGEGIGFKDNKKVCVKNVLEGEEVCVNIKSQKNLFLNCELVKINKPSSIRITPPCKYYNNCGGCDFQFINYSNSLKIKKQILSNYFSDLYSKDIEVIASNNNFNYRNKASFFVSNGKIGFQKENSNEIVEIDNCLVVNPLINEAFLIFKKWILEDKPKDVTHIVIRVLNNKLMFVVVCKTKINNFQNLISGLKNVFLEGNFGLYENINTQSNKILSNNFIHIYGLETLETICGKIRYFIHPNSFMQINDDIKNKLYQEVLNNIDSSEIVIEGYSGAGLLSALISTKAKKVFAVEINKFASQDAEKVKKQNKITNLENINGDCKDVLKEIIKKYENATFVIDPARSGCDMETLKAIEQSNIKKIIYISCNPYTLKQNIVYLKDKYKIENMKMFDMFPQTSHTETLTILVKN